MAFSPYFPPRLKKHFFDNYNFFFVQAPKVNYGTLFSNRLKHGTKHSTSYMSTMVSAFTIFDGGLGEELFKQGVPDDR